MSSMDVGSERPAARGASEGPVLIHVWEVLGPEHEGLILERLDKMLTATATDPASYPQGCFRAPTDSQSPSSWRCEPLRIANVSSDSPGSAKRLTTWTTR